jgi:hypothetical protein
MSNTETPKTKTETPKTEAKSQPASPANPFAAFTSFDPMGYWTASQQMMRDMMTDAMTAAQSNAAQLADRYAALDPMGYWTSFRSAMTTAQQHGSSVAGKLDAQYVELEAQLVERAHTAVATWAQLANDSINYAAKLSAEARKLGADAAKKMGASA